MVTMIIGRFQIGNERKREFHAAEIRFYLHKEYVGAILKKSVILFKENWSHMDKFQYLKNFRAARANLFTIS